MKCSIPLHDSKSVAIFLRKRILKKDVEEFWVIALNSLCVVISAEMLFRGTADSCLVHPRDIFRFALLKNAISLIVGHNHPSQSQYPSQEDVSISRELRRAGQLLKIPLLDHVIVTEEQHFSFAESFWGRNQ